jgi:hypothetical protein
VLEEAAYAEDALVTEYIGGVLASSRSENTRDDRAVTYLALVSRLSAYDLRLHYISYFATHRLLCGSGIDLSDSQQAEDRGQIFLPQEPLFRAMEFSDNENAEEITDHSAVTLSTENLIGPFGAGGLEYTAQFLAFPEPGFVFTPTSFGVQLFLWANGRTNFADFMDATAFDEPVVTMPARARLARSQPEDLDTG